MPEKDAEQKLSNGSIRVVLSRPIPAPTSTGIGTLDALVFREPTAEDVEIAGCPVTIDSDRRGTPSVAFSEAKMNAMFERLSGTPLPFIRKMRASDWTACAWAIAPFFVPGVRT
jgi:hypothetical protein